MPLQECKVDGAPGWKFGKSGHCYTYTDGNASSEKRAKKQAVKQALATAGGKAPPELSDRDLADAGYKTCAKCGSAHKLRQFPADARTKDGHSNTCVGCKFSDDRHAGQRNLAELETVNLDGVPILATGGPYFGTGSPPEGDTFDDDFLKELANAYEELKSEIKVPIKIGHSKAQKLLKNSGLADDEMPSAGWVTNLRASGGQLLADLTDVPKKIADLIEKKAFRTRSVELTPVTSQTKDGREYPTVVTALALLGAKAPAVRTLDDILSGWYSDATRADTVALLYADEHDPDVQRTVDYAAGEVIWDSENGSNDWRDDLAAALNAGASSADNTYPNPYYVQDVDQLNRRAIVCDWRTNTNWVIGFSVDSDGDPVPAPQESWTLAEQAWVEAAADANATQAAGYAPTPAPATDQDYSERVHDSGEGSHTYRVADGTQTWSDEQIAEFAKLFGVEAEDADKRREQVLAKFAENAPKPDDDDKTEPPATEPPAAAEATATVGLSAADKEKLMSEARDLYEKAGAKRQVEANVMVAMRQGRIDPKDEKDWREFGEERGVELLVKHLTMLPPNLELMKAYGKGDKPDNDAGDGEAWYREYAAMSGVPVREAASS